MSVYLEKTLKLISWNLIDRQTLVNIINWQRSNNAAGLKFIWKKKIQKLYPIGFIFFMWLSVVLSSCTIIFTFDYEICTLSFYNADMQYKSCHKSHNSYEWFNLALHHFREFPLQGILRRSEMHCSSLSGTFAGHNTWDQLLIFTCNLSCPSNQGRAICIHFHRLWPFYDSNLTSLNEVHWLMLKGNERRAHTLISLICWVVASTKIQYMISLITIFAFIPTQ